MLHYMYLLQSYRGTEFLISTEPHVLFHYIIVVAVLNDYVKIRHLPSSYHKEPVHALLTTGVHAGVN